jgi:hypothetical protein
MLEAQLTEIVNQIKKAMGRTTRIRCTEDVFRMTVAGGTMGGGTCAFRALARSPSALPASAR